MFKKNIYWKYRINFFSQKRDLIILFFEKYYSIFFIYFFFDIKYQLFIRILLENKNTQSLKFVFWKTFSWFNFLFLNLNNFSIKAQIDYFLSTCAVSHQAENKLR